ncbi:MAG: 3'-5' exonuclease, partial [Marinospirillum sp.]|uniref:exonuclease domain-containing protein n=1 Tax=Marinospirillum sp. TaxID=2183934 RepID=UPI0019F4248C
MVLKTIRTATDRWSQKDGEFSFMFDTYEGDEIVALDCEMTDLDPQKAELVSIAAVKIKGTQVLTSE